MYMQPYTSGIEVVFCIGQCYGNETHYPGKGDTHPPPTSLTDLMVMQV